MFKSRITAKYLLVEADFKSVALKFQHQGHSESEVKKAIERFKTLRDQKKIKDVKERDIEHWGKRQFKDFTKFLSTLDEAKTRTARKLAHKPDVEGAKLVAENSDYYMFHITTKDACIYLGQDTKWCITQKEEEHWENYENGDFYYYISKKLNARSDPLAKIALYIIMDGSKHYFDALNNDIAPPKTLPKYDIPTPEFSWDKVKGLEDINVSSIGLTSLEGAPKAVGGDFDCSENYLTSLKGAPKTVRGGFYCTSNKLTSLKGAPKTVGVDFDCSRNKLTSLEGAPEKVGGDFYCRNNNLTSLEGAPEKVGGSFYCYKNELTSLKGAPKTVNGNFYCSGNMLTSLEGAPEKVGGDFYCRNNNLTSLEGAPKTVNGNFSCDYNIRKFTEAEVRAVCNVKGEVLE